jgi:RNA polymerase sigma factor FliA
VSSFRKQFKNGVGDAAIVRMALELREPQSLFAQLYCEPNSRVVDSLPIGKGKADESTDYAVGDPEQDPFSSCLRSEIIALLVPAIAELPERERQILSFYYCEKLTLKEIGVRLGVGESRVCQIHSQAILHLRACLQLNDPDDGVPTPREPCRTPHT